ncbi:amino acid permease [Candidatus Omnitrophota bacterium]
MKLKKELTFVDVFCISSGAMISSGIFILPGLAFARTGPAVIISYLLAGLLALIGIFSVIELSTAMPKAGGDYYFINRSLGPLIGTISGFLGWIALSLKSAFAIFGIAEIVFLATGIKVIFSSIAICLFFIFLNIRGVKKAAKLQVYLVLGLLVLMALYIILGFSKVNVSHFVPFAPQGINSIIVTAGFIFISFGGLLKVASISEEVKNPKRNIPLGMIASVVVVTVIYTLLLVVLVGVLDSAQLSNSLTPVADSAKIFMGMPGFIAISIAALLAFITTANAGMMAASRYPLALSRDRLLPDAISKVSKKYKTPIISIYMTGIFILLALLLPLEMLVKAASTVILTSYVLTNLSVIIFRESKIQNYQPSFKVPLYPWLQIFGIIVFSFFIIDMGLDAIEISLSFLAMSAGFYFFYGRKKYIGTNALLHLIENIMAKELTSSSLETELKEIILERDDVVTDRFDSIVEKCVVLDIDEAMELDDFLKLAADTLSKSMKVKTSNLFDLISERERETSTVIAPGIAIPHIIVDGEKLFDVLLVRCKKGIAFSASAPKVHVVFVLIGSKDERNFHLRALAAIAQIVQNPSFNKKWMSAKNDKALKDIVLMGDRMR